MVLRLAILLLFLSLGLAALPLVASGPFPQNHRTIALSLGSAGVVLGLIHWFWRRRKPARYIVVDGSNVIYWADNTPDLANVAIVLGVLAERGFTPVVWFDANVGYLIGDTYLGPGRLAGRLGLPARQVFVAPKGTPADPLLLDGAKALDAQVVTNDRFRDWTGSHPQLAAPGLLIRGRIDNGQARLEFAPADAL